MGEFLAAVMLAVLSFLVGVILVGQGISEDIITECAKSGLYDVPTVDVMIECSIKKDEGT